MEIIYRTDIRPDTDQIIDVYNSSGINRPTAENERIAKMYDNSNLIVAQVWSTVYNSSCASSTYKQAASWNSNSKTATPDASVGYEYGYQIINSNHKVKIDGTYYSYDQELKSCD